MVFFISLFEFKCIFLIFLFGTSVFSTFLQVTLFSLTGKFTFREICQPSETWVGDRKIKLLPRLPSARLLCPVTTSLSVYSSLLTRLQSIGNTVFLSLQARHGWTAVDDPDHWLFTDHKSHFSAAHLSQVSCRFLTFLESYEGYIPCWGVVDFSCEVSGGFGLRPTPEASYRTRGKPRGVFSNWHNSQTILLIQLY